MQNPEPTSTNRRAQGAQHEDRAARHLLDLGYTLLTRRWKSSRGEIDLIAFDGPTLVFVEVKARRGNNATPEASVDAAKIRAFSTAAVAFAEKHSLSDAPFRFDLIAIDTDGLRHHVDAFRAPSPEFPGD